MVSPESNSAAGDGVGNVVLLGGIRMPATSEEADGSSRQEGTERAIALLEEALQIMDDLGEFPELGARLHGLIEALRDESGT